MKKIKIGEVTAEPGTKSRGFLKVANRPDGSAIGIPFIVINGARDGPMLCVDACVHGDEVEGTEAIIKLQRMIDPKKLSGAFIGVPVVNILAFEASDRMNPLEHERTDMNRIFPGRERYLSEKIAFTHFNEIICKSNYYISFHGGGMTEYIEPMVYYQTVVSSISKEVAKKSLEMAKAFGVEILYRGHESPGISVYEAARKGIPGILPEIGGQCDRYRNRQNMVNLCAEGVLNVMKHLGMIEGKLEPPPEQKDLEITMLFNKCGGLWIPEVKAPKFVEKGTVLGRIINPFFGDELEVIKAPFEGLVVMTWMVPIVQAGDWVCMVGKVMEKI